MERRVLIVGAGIAGQSLATALSRAGTPYDIVEAKAEFDIVGSGMYVQNNALRCFAEIGVAEAIMATGWRSPSCESQFLDMDGNFITRAAVPPCAGSTLPGYVPISRARLHDILHDAALAAGAQIRMATTVTALADDPDGVDVTFSDGSRGRYALVVGADGVNSAIRKLVFADVAPSYSGFSNWRVTLPMPEPRGFITWQMGEQTSLGIIPIASDALYLALVTKEPGNPWFDHASLLDLMLDRARGYRGPARPLLDAIPGPESVIYTPVNEVMMPPPWYKGRVVLVGDAAHASTPFWAQGASMAVEDVLLLSRLLQTGFAMPAVLGEWQERRYARCAYVQQGSKATGVAGHAEGIDPAARRAHLIAHAQDDMSRRYWRLNQPI